MTIHSGHPFADPSPDPVRRLRGRVTGAVSLWTAGDVDDRAGLTVSSLMVAGGEPGRVLALLDPDADLTALLARTGRAVVQLLSWRHRDLAEAFAGTAPSPGGPFRAGAFSGTAYGPLLDDAASWACVSLEEAREVGWSRLVTCTLDEVTIDDDPEPLVHHRGRWARGPAGDH